VFVAESLGELGNKETILSKSLENERLLGTDSLISWKEGFDYGIDLLASEGRVRSHRACCIGDGIFTRAERMIMTDEKKVPLSLWKGDQDLCWDFVAQNRKTSKRTPRLHPPNIKRLEILYWSSNSQVSSLFVYSSRNINLIIAKRTDDKILWSPTRRSLPLQKLLQSSNEETLCESMLDSSKLSSA